jgi:hypothetical protein
MKAEEERNLQKQIASRRILSGRISKRELKNHDENAQSVYSTVERKMNHQIFVFLCFKLR